MHALTVLSDKIKLLLAEYAIEHSTACHMLIEYCHIRKVCRYVRFQHLSKLIKLNIENNEAFKGGLLDIAGECKYSPKSVLSGMEVQHVRSIRKECFSKNTPATIGLLRVLQRSLNGVQSNLAIK
ncbi:hypothetical protein SDC9_184773 [bioreactor metagenome]|uniref:Uncharacterized protein n=1 Tax=bioreactor metagenome TaxID=1076179 RepID=A0A645HDZ4_9ZZZZ